MRSPPARPLLVLACVLALAAAAVAAPGVRPSAAMRGGGAGDTAKYFPAQAPLNAKEFGFTHWGGLFHLFYMRRWPDSLGEVSFRGFGHAVSSDLRHWTELDTILAVQPGEWDADHVWSPSLARRGGTWYLFYTGVKNVPFPWTWYQQIGVATSTDLVNWTHYGTPVLNAAMVPWTLADSSRFEGSQFRDAFVMADPADTTRWLMYYVTIPTAAQGQLVVGLARNAGGLAAWQDAGPMWATDAAHHYGWSESPVLLPHGGLWYLFMTTTAAHCLRYSIAPDPTADSTLWSGPYDLFENAGRDTVSDAWFGPEVLTADGHDLLAFVDSNDGSIGFREIAWGATPTDFTLRMPGDFGGVTNPAPGGRLALAALGQPGAGPRVLFRIASPGATAGRLEILDLAGRRVGLAHDGPLPAGESFAEWDGRDRDGTPARPGIYFARLATPFGTRVVRVAVAR